MQNRYTGDIGDFGKFLLLKHLFTSQRIATIWYLYPDETHNADGRHTVDVSNVNLFQACSTIDPHMSDLFNAIHANTIRRVELFETLKILENGGYFSKEILGETKHYRDVWLSQACRFIEQGRYPIVCLDPDNGMEPSSMSKLSIIKQGKYATFEELDRFFSLDGVEHLVIYQHFNRLKKHAQQMAEMKNRFESLYHDKASVTLIRHNPVQARFYIILSKTPLEEHRLNEIESYLYHSRPFFTIY